MKKLKRHAPELLEASKSALRFFLRQDPLADASDEQERRKVMEQLREVIDLADPPNNKFTGVKLVMTHRTYEVLEELLVREENALFALQEGCRKTKQRVYVELPINHAVLRKINFVLEHKAPSQQKNAFKRLAEQITEDGLSKNPMEILAETGL